MKQVKAKKRVVEKVTPKLARPLDFWQAQRAAFVETWKATVTGHFWKAGSWDLALIAIIYILSSITSLLVYNVVGPLMPAVLEVNAMKIMENPAYEDAFVDIAPQVHQAIWNSIIIIFASGLLGVLIFSYFNGRAWSVVRKEKFTPVLFRKLFMLNIVWFAEWTIIFTLIFNFADLLFQPLFFFACALFFSCDHVLRTKVSEKKGIFKTLWEAKALTLRKIHWFLLIIAAWIISTLLMFFITGAVSLALFWAGYLLLPAFVLFAVGFSRVYFYNITKALE